MNTVMGNLFDRAERVGAALLICDDQDRIVKVNQKQAKLYGVVNFSSRPGFEQVQWELIKQHKLADPKIYEDPAGWIDAASRFRKMSDYAQFITRHSDGRVLFVCHERVRSVNSWWYQVRIDVTTEVKSRFTTDDALLGPACWEGTFTPLTKNSSVPVSNVVEALPAASGLIMARGKLLEANRALRAILEEGDGLRRIDGRVVATEPSENAKFLAHLNRFFEQGSQCGRVGMRISRQNSEYPFFLSISSLLDLGKEAWDDSNIGVLTIANPSIAPSIDPDLLVDFLGLTPAEAEIAAALGAGHTTALIAERRGVAINTIYNQIKKIVEKTGYSGQADIARRVSDMARIFGNR